MFFNINKIFENPLLVIGIFFIVAVFIYLSTELFKFKSKTKEQKSTTLFGWGVLLIIIAIILLFTTTVSFVINNLYSINKEEFTLNELRKLCSADKLSEVNYIIKQDTRDSCRIIDISSYISYSLLALGPIFIIFGLYIKTLYIKENQKKPIIKTPAKEDHN